MPLRLLERGLQIRTDFAQFAESVRELVLFTVKSHLGQRLLKGSQQHVDGTVSSVLGQLDIFGSFNGCISSVSEHVAGTRSTVEPENSKSNFSFTNCAKYFMVNMRLALLVLAVEHIARQITIHLVVQRFNSLGIIEPCGFSLSYLEQLIEWVIGDLA